MTVHVDAPPEQVWGLVSDVTNTSRFSPETFEAEWIDGSTGPEVGARFRGHVKRNGRGPTYWTKCTVTVSEPGREFSFVVGTPKNHPMTWGYRFEPAGGGTDVTEFYELAENLPAEALLEALREGPGPHQRPQHAGHARADQGRGRRFCRRARIAGRPAILVVLHPGTPVTGAL